MVLFSSALLALLPWHFRWARAIPAEGLLGRISSDVLVHHLNLAGAYIVVDRGDRRCAVSLHRFLVHVDPGVVPCAILVLIRGMGSH